ncbi:hypothetical protein Taro_007443 [Colocasia esculenta]|uniref:Uncharacterized protein n=1 Tax=Colocasia esculenta TaxID=4460 RepID=A0A843U0E7_COLES|nr:hypothetical protein [Colocasia esculenta]
MATYTSTVAQNENIHILRGKGIGGVKADLPKPGKKDCKDRKALADLSKPAKHLGSTAVEASSLKQKSQQGTKTTKKAQTSNILTEEETKKCFEWEEEEIEKVHFTGNDILKHERDAMDKRVKEKVDMVLSCMGEWNRILYHYATPVKILMKAFWRNLIFLGIFLSICVSSS